MSRAVLALALVALAAGSSAVNASVGHRCLVVASPATTGFDRNFNPFGQSVDFTWGGIYEPLVVVTQAGGGHEYLWLASKLTWSSDRRTLLITVRHGVKWSDGQPLTTRDVLFTLTAGRRERVMDQIGLRRRGNDVASVELAGADQVAIHLRHRDSTFVASVLANNLRVVPEHIFAHLHHVAAWRNPHPVGTGPFAVVGRFGTESYTLERNPNYWKRGAPHVPCIEDVLASSGDSALLQMLRGSIDLTNDYIPNVQKAYVSHDPAHFHYFYATTGVPVGLFFDDTRYPYSLVALRKAISMAIDRAAISRFAELGYAPPVDAIGIDRNWPEWIDRSSAREARRLAAYDPDGARKTLLAAGFSYAGTALLDPHGHRVVLAAKVIGSWTDWVTTWQVIAQDLRAIGIVVDLNVVPGWGEWQPDAFATRSATLLWNNSGSGPTPYDYFEEHLGRASFVPSGRQADVTGNWEHFWSPEGTSLLERFKATFDGRQQHRLARALDRVWLRTLPYVPLFVGPNWSTYSTRYFTGFPSATDYYLQPGFLTSDYVVALTRIRPVR